MKKKNFKIFAGVVLLAACPAMSVYAEDTGIVKADALNVRSGPSTEDQILGKLKNGQKFLADGNRLKISVRFRGREMAHTEIGAQLLKDFAAQCADIANMDKAPKLEGRNMSVFLSPKPVTPAKKPAKPKAPKAPEAEG